jgi:hypothetical protein
MCQNYGVLNRHGSHKPVKAHRFSFELHERQLKEGEVVRHLCHNPACVNPKHLAAGSQADNIRDDSLLGKRYRKIDEDTAMLVFADRDRGMTYRGLAAKYGVHHSTIRQMLTGLSHKVPKEKYDQAKQREKQGQTGPAMDR